jgi:hypothetical protein
MSQLYHRDIGLPAAVESLFGHTFKFRFTRHSLQACLSDRYGKITPPASLKIEPGQIVEAESDGAAVYKVVVRVPHKEGFDICIAFLPNLGGESLVKTCWLNRTTDKHATLDKSKYAVHVVP